MGQRGTAMAITPFTQRFQYAITALPLDTWLGGKIGTLVCLMVLCHAARLLSFAV